MSEQEAIDFLVNVKIDIDRAIQLIKSGELRSADVSTMDKTVVLVGDFKILKRNDTRT